MVRPDAPEIPRSAAVDNDREDSFREERGAQGFRVFKFEMKPIAGEVASAGVAPVKFTGSRGRPRYATRSQMNRTNAALHRELVTDPSFIAGGVSIHYLESKLEHEH